MPLYDYNCAEHGRFENLKPMNDGASAICPACGEGCLRVPSLIGAIRVIDHPYQRYGNKSKGRMVTSEETGGLPVLIPSFGVLEKEEIDYIAEGAIEKEKGRKRQRRVSAQKDKMECCLAEGLKAKPGQRAKTIEAVMKG